ILRRIVSEDDFLSPYGVRSLSREHLTAPAFVETSFGRFSISYEPAEARSGNLGRNSNWRGPVWIPVSYLLIESLRTLHDGYGDLLRVECPTGWGNELTMVEIAALLCRRVTPLFLPNPRPAGSTLTEPRHAEGISFSEFFNGDSGKGLGASHQ